MKRCMTSYRMPPNELNIKRTRAAIGPFFQRSAKFERASPYQYFKWLDFIGRYEPPNNIEKTLIFFSKKNHSV